MRLPDFLSGFAADVAACLRFYSRIPLPALPFETAAHAAPDFARAPRALPIAALIIALPPAAALALGDALGFSSALTSVLTLAVSALTTGAFHEDGLADVADGFGGGASRERKLEIMRDSRVGTYGASALVLSFGARGAALAALLDAAGPAAACAAWAMTAVAARIGGLVPLWRLEPARVDGVAWAAQRPTTRTMGEAAVLSAAAIAAVGTAGGFSPHAMLAAAAAAAAAGFAMSGVARRQIGGQTGDVAGAAEQLGEIAILSALSALAGQ